MSRRSWSLLLVSCAVCLPCLPGASPGQYPAARAREKKSLALVEIASARGAAAGPPWTIVLRSRSGEAVPERNKDGVTGASHIEVDQEAPDRVVFWLRGAVAAGAEQWKGGMAAIHFKLEQDFEVVPTRLGLRPPRLLLGGTLIGTIQSIRPEGGSAAHGPACAAVTSADHPVLRFCTPPHTVNSGQKLFVNDREGPLEMVVCPGGYHLSATFEISAEQPYSICHHLGAGAGAFFDPSPRLEPRWNFVQQPFRGVPSRDFGFAIVLQVMEDGPPPGVEGVESLPTPRPLDTVSPKDKP